jgi:SAM-dependent methyltransferase
MASSYKTILHKLAAFGDAFGHPWKKASAIDSFSMRHYRDYADYVRHQSSKLSKLDLASYESNFADALKRRLAKLDLRFEGKSVLCLGARTGAECRAFIALGSFAVGIDLNPGSGNRHVLVGDFHELQFADRSVDYVYTNALDHALDLKKVALEARRILKPAGALIAEIVHGSEDSHGRQPGTHESLWWQRSADVVSALCKAGYELQGTEEITQPFSGIQAVLKPLT